MATARPGWSRRAQYGLFFTLLGVIAGVIIGLVLLIALARRVGAQDSQRRNSDDEDAPEGADT